MKKLVFLCLIILSFSCKKSNINDHDDFVGTWRNTSSNITKTLEVDDNGKSSYEEVTESGNLTKTKSFNGRFILEGTVLKIGFKKFQVNQEPELENGTWTISLDNTNFTRD
jgi:hypothetical protein